MNKGASLVSYYDNDSSSSDEENTQDQQSTSHSIKENSPRIEKHKNTELRQTDIDDTTNKTIIEEKEEEGEVKDVSEPTTPTSPPPPSPPPVTTAAAPTPVNTVNNNRVLDRSSLLKDILIPKPIDGIDNWGILPEPNTECDSEQQEKIEHFLSLRKSGHSLNEHLQKNKSFRNPRIYAKLVEFVDIDELGSNFPKEQFDPKGFPPSSYIDGILETQHKIAEEKAQQVAKGRTQLAFVSSSSSNISSTPTSSSTPPLSKQSMNNNNTSSPSLSSSADKASKLAAAMANAAKIASRIVKPTHPQSTTNTTITTSAPSSLSTTTATSSSSTSHHTSSSSSSHIKRSSHNKWDRSDEKRRHR